MRQIASRASAVFDLKVILGISSVQALAARHQISLNGVGEAIHITTGRRLAGEPFPQNASVAVLLEGQCAFKSVAAFDLDIYWGPTLEHPTKCCCTAGSSSSPGGSSGHARRRAKEKDG